LEKLSGPLAKILAAFQNRSICPARIELHELRIFEMAAGVF
jgi:hypothetical protein